MVKLNIFNQGVKLWKEVKCTGFHPLNNSMHFDVAGDTVTLRTNNGITYFDNCTCKHCSLNQEKILRNNGLCSRKIAVTLFNALGKFNIDYLLEVKQ